MHRKKIYRVRLPFVGTVALARDPGEAAFSQGLLAYTNLQAQHRRGGRLLEERDLGSGVITAFTVNEMVADTIYGTLAAPSGLGVAQGSTTGGSLASGTTYYYVITGTKAGGRETLQSGQVSFAPASGSTNQATVTWTALSGAEGYKIYRSTTSGTYGASSLLTTITSGATVTYTDTGSATTSGTPPTLNTSGASWLSRAVYMDSGTGTTAAADNDTALQTPTGLARVVATITNAQTATGGGAGNHTAQAKWSGTITYNANFAVTEWGLLDALTGGNLMDHRIFSVINVSSGKKVAPLAA